jgi:hypothetical protein
MKQKIGSNNVYMYMMCSNYFKNEKFARQILTDVTIQ